MLVYNRNAGLLSIFICDNSDLMNKDNGTQSKHPLNFISNVLSLFCLMLKQPLSCSVYLCLCTFNVCVSPCRTGEFRIDVTVSNLVSSASLSSHIFVVDRPCQPPPVKNMGPLKLQVHYQQDCYLIYNMQVEYE